MRTKHLSGKSWDASPPCPQGPDGFPSRPKRFLASRLVRSLRVQAYRKRFSVARRATRSGQATPVAARPKVGLPLRGNPMLVWMTNARTARLPVTLWDRSECQPDPGQARRRPLATPRINEKRFSDRFGGPSGPSWTRPPAADTSQPTCKAPYHSVTKPPAQQAVDHSTAAASRGRPSSSSTMR